MKHDKDKLQRFTDLETWKAAHSLVLKTFQLTQRFPEEERYGLSAQMRRAAVSVTSNIAEGFSRGTYKDKTHFYTIARGSLSELESQMYIVKDLEFISQQEAQDFDRDIEKTGKLLTALRKSVIKHHT